MNALPPLVLDGRPLSIADVESVSRQKRRVEVDAQALQRVLAARGVVDAATSDGQAHYGINTGFGSLSRTRIEAGDLRALQENLVRSHAAGVGKPLPIESVRGMMLLLAASLCRARSGVRPVVIERLVELLNRGVTPFVPRVGSVGASGDLAPLAHVALVLIGEGRAYDVEGELTDGRDALTDASLTPLTLEAKEGLALINGTHLMAARGALLLARWDRLFSAAVCAGAMSIDGCRATDAFLDDRAHELRRQSGPRKVAAKLRELLTGSAILPSHLENDPRVQDPYSLRCMPQVLGASLDAVAYARKQVQAELGAVTDNPLVFPDSPAASAIVSAGNFHGMPLAIPLDTLAIAVAHVAGISERRTFLMLAASDPEAHLRPYLAPHPGLNSGLMIAQYTAAACCNEIIGLANPASPANIGTSAGMEDYNSFGPRSAAKAAQAMTLAETVIAIELLCAAQALEYQRPLKSGVGVERAYEIVRTTVAPLTADRSPSEDIDAIAASVRDGAFEIGLVPADEQV